MMMAKLGAGTPKGKGKKTKAKAKGKSKKAAKANTPMKRPAAALPSTPQKSAKTSEKSAAGKPKFPGIPKKAVEAVQYKNWNIYTDIRAAKWRCKEIGERKDKGFSFKHKEDAAENWARLLKHMFGSSGRTPAGQRHSCLRQCNVRRFSVHEWPGSWALRLCIYFSDLQIMKATQS